VPDTEHPERRSRRPNTIAVGVSAPGTSVPGTSTQHPAPGTEHPTPSTQPPAPSTQRPFRLIVFDLDGTLIDSRRDLTDSVNVLLVECGGPALPEERVGRMVGDGAATLIARAFEAVGIARPPDALPRFLAVYGQRLTKHTRPYQGIPRVLSAFRERARLAILTNKPLGSTRMILDDLDLAKYFDPDLVIGGDGPFARKPDPSGLQSLMRAVSAAAEETLMVGDSTIDWHTARAAGTRICIARYGFGFEGFVRERLAHDAALIDAPEGLLQL
jgi:phosphoglycolate phosphatase